MTLNKPACKPLRPNQPKSLIRGCSSMVEQQLPKRVLLSELRHLFANPMLLQGNASSNLVIGCKL